MLDRRTFISTSAAVGVAYFAPNRQGPRDGWRVNGDRVNQLLSDLSNFGANPGGGVTRVGYSDADIAAREFVVGAMRKADLDVRVDAIGNIFGRRNGLDPTAPPIMFGSHIDSVPGGGNYDGDVGSMSAIEVAHTLMERSYSNRHPVNVVIWADEESGSTGARAFVGNFDPAELDRPRPDGSTLRDAISRSGGDPNGVTDLRQDVSDVAAYVELHVEQGGVLDRAGIQIGVVDGIVGIDHYYVSFLGEPNHAGTTPMDQRRNAMLAASALVLAVDQIVRSAAGSQVGTVGRLMVSPGAPNVIPGRVDLTVELRDLSTDKLQSLWQSISAEAASIASRYDVDFQWEAGVSGAPALTDPRVRSVITNAATSMGLSTRNMPSGAGHDAQELARICPMGMIFVPSVGGISHSPREYTRPEDVENGTNVLLQTVLRLDIGSM